MSKNMILSELLLSRFEKFAENHAVWSQGKYYSYKELYFFSHQIAIQLIEKTSERCAIYSNRNITAYAAILGCVFAKKTYVPLNPKNPWKRTQMMLDQAETDMIIVDKNAEQSEFFLGNLKKSFWVLLIGYEKIPTWASKISHHHYQCLELACNKNIFDEVKKKSCKQERFTIKKNSYSEQSTQNSHIKHIYLLFTSGSTGLPKAVCVSQNNLLAYINNIIYCYQPSVEDRFSQITELTFDVSVHEMFVCWAVGACLYMLPEKYFMKLDKFINTHCLTFFISVPSTIGFLKKIQKLKPGIFHSLRSSLFCGEALSDDLAAEWQSAASHSTVDNLYGPTEATVVCMHHRWKKQSKRESLMVPIGKPFPDQKAVIINKERQQLGIGEIGELCLSGTQIVEGYWNNPEASADRFINLFPKDDSIWYLTGDLAYCDEAGVYHYKGRFDDEIKIRGYLVNKMEIENFLKKLTGNPFVAVIFIESQQEKILRAFIGISEIDREWILRECRSHLPDYMIPTEIIAIPEFPLNQNGKIDYRKLRELD